MSELLAGTGHGVERALTGPRRFITGGENLVVIVALAAMAVVPLAELALRAILRVGIPGSSSVVQHLTLAVALLGGAIAAREGRLLSLSTGGTLVAGRFRPAVRVFTGATCAAVSSLLCAAGVQLVLSEREGGKILAGGVPVWVAQVLLPVGFGLVALRLLHAASDSWPGRALAGTLAAILCAVGVWPPIEPSAMIIPAMIVLLAATVLGAPVFAALGGAALILFWGSGGPVAAIPVEMYRLVVSPTLPMIPLFTLAGYFLSEGGAPRRLVRVFSALTGWARGGPALVVALVCAFFTSFTGASGVTILALGGLLMPVLLAARYSEKNALGLLTSAGSLGLLFPPSLPVILYGIVSHTPIDKMFLGGFLPGVLMVGLTALWGRRCGAAGTPVRQKFDPSEAASALYAAKWEMLLPVVVLVGLFGGFATQVEAAALTALYAFVIETFVYKDLRLVRDTPRVMTECIILVGGVLLILGVALGFTSYLVDAEVPTAAVAWVKGSIESPLVFLLLLNLFLLVVGCLMDIFSAIVVVVPLIAPMGAAFGIDPVHMGVIFLVNMELGYLTPPVGMNLFLSSYRFNKPLSEVYISVIPMLLVLLVGVLLITYIPAMTTTLPRWFSQ